MRRLLFLFGLCASAQQIPIPEAQPLPPSQDPWYSAPVGFENTAPGTILRFRSAPGNLTTAVISNATAAYNILYRTTDSRYHPSWAVTTLFIPEFFYETPSGNTALVSYQFAQDSANVDTAASYGLYYALARGVPSLGVPASTDLVNILLSLGWAVNTPDHEGPYAAFGESVQQGHATLDSLRAIQNFNQILGGTNFSMAIWGYSGGSVATEAAAELQVQYAPELNISGAVIGGLVTDFSSGFDLYNNSLLAGAMIAGLLGLTVQYPEAAAYLESRLVPATASEFLSARNLSQSEVTSTFSGKDIYSYFMDGPADLQAPILQALCNVESKLGNHGVPAMPLYAYKAINDEYCPINQTDALVEKYCDVGAHITYARNTVGGHVAEIMNGQPGAIEWLQGIFNESNTVLESGCETKNVTVEISSLSS